MLNLKKQIIGGLIALSVGGMTLAATADTSTDPAGQPNAEMMAKSQARMDKHQEKMAKRQAELHAKLKLSSAQEPAWNAFIAQAKQPQADAGMQRPDRRAESNLTTPQRMALQLARLQNAEKFMTARLDAVKTFYAVLTPAQQKVFDAEHQHQHGWFGGHHGFWHHDRDGEHDGRSADGKPAASP